VTGDGQARICEGLGVKFPGATRRAGLTRVPTATVAGVSGQPLPLCRSDAVQDKLISDVRLRDLLKV
jgi:hypothetical protein